MELINIHSLAPGVAILDLQYQNDNNKTQRAETLETRAERGHHVLNIFSSNKTKHNWGNCETSQNEYE